MMTTKIGVQAAADYLNGAFQTGWIPGEQEDLSSPTLKKPVTAEYMAANQIKIVGLDWTDRIQKGTKIRYKQGGDWKYDFVSEITANTDTTLTLLGGSTVENEAVTDFWFSNSATPVGWPFGVDYIEGSNANGSWKKYVDGTAECWGSFSTGEKDYTTVFSGSLYRTESFFIPWPIEFDASPRQSLMVQWADAMVFLANTLAPTTTNSGTMYLIKNGSSTGVRAAIDFEAKGRYRA